MSEFCITDKQARFLALSVYKDIKAYCIEHKEKFEQFLAEQDNREEGECDEMDNF